MSNFIPISNAYVNVDAIEFIHNGEDGPVIYYNSGGSCSCTEKDVNIIKNVLRNKEGI